MHAQMPLQFKNDNFIYQANEAVPFPSSIAVLYLSTRSREGDVFIMQVWSDCETGSLLQ